MSLLYRSAGKLAAVGAFAFLGWASATASFFDLVNDWSDVNNPMGQWSLLKLPNTLFTVNQSNYWGDASNMHAWADDPYPGALHVPFWAKIDAAHQNTHGYDAPANSILMHGNDPNRTGSEYTAAVFTSPSAGLATVAGDVWLSYKTSALPRGMNWQILKNNSLLTEGFLSWNDSYTSTTPMSFALGTGGAGALIMQVAVGDKIELRMLPNHNSPNDGVPIVAGLHVGVNLAPVPEPFTMFLGVAGLTAAAIRRRRRV